ncbi:MAG TPA: VWA domain-containing protein [Terriglobia bacterium]|nr:VWA domain-containing protein [Terriglobia bacterium]
MNLRRLFGTGTLLVLLIASVHLLAQDPVPPIPSTPQVPAPSAPGTVNDPIRLNISVDLVNVSATVRDSSGRYIDGLTQENFTLLENGIEQKLSFFNHDTQTNLSVGVLVDTSGSMRHKLQQALQTVREVALALGPQDEMFLITFSDDVEIRQKFTRNPDDVLRALRGVRSGGETSVYDALQIGINEMRSARNGKRIILLVSDGYDTRSKINMDQALEQLKRSQLQLYAIGIDDDDNDPLVLRQPRYHVYLFMLGELTGASGGQTFRMYTGRNYALDSIAALILEELHNQYTLGYYPSTPKDGSWRTIQVKTDRPGSVVRSRAGYYAVPMTP